MTSIESTMASQINLNGSNNDEESIFLSSSDDDKDHESVDRDEYLAQEHLDDENAGYDDDDASDNDDFAYGNSYDDEDAGRERRPIKVYDEYDPENIDNNEEYSDDDDIPLNLYSRKKKQQEASESQASKEDSDVEELDQSSSDEERPPKKRGRPKRAQELASSKKPRAGRKPAAKPPSARKKPSRTATNSDSDSTSSAAESDPKSKHAKKNPTKENVNTDSSSIKNLVKKTSNSNKTASLSTTLGSKQKTTKLSQAQNIISGRVINFESGFKIPKRPSNESSSIEKEPPEKKTKTEPIDKEKTKIKDSKETVKQKTSSKPPSQVSSKNSIDKKTDKKIQPVKNGFKESADFLEALSSSSSRKHSHSSKKPTVASVARVEPAKNESSQDLKKPEPSLKTNLESTCNSTPCLINRVESVDNSDSTSLLNSHSSITTTTTTTSTNNTSTTIATIGASSDSNLAKLNSNGPKSNLIISGSKKVTKKKVIWADSCSQQLESVQFFYLDESERVIKKEAYHGADMSKVDKLSEKEFTFRITSGHGFADFNEETASTWPASLVPIDLPESTIIPDIKSIERDIQAKREANTLAVLVFKKFMPDSASEPDPEPAVSEPPSTKLIPLEEVNGTDTKLSDVPESDKPSQEVSKAKPALLSHPTTKTPLLPTPPPPLPAPVQPPSSSSDASGSKTEPANILNMLNLSNLSSSLLRSNEDAERLKKILSLVGTADSAKSPDDKFHEFEQPPNKNNIPKTDTNNNPRWNNNNNWQTHNKYSNQTFNRNYNQNSNQNANNYNQGRNVFVNNFKRGIGNRAAGSFGRDGHAHNYRGNDSRGGFNRQNYAMHGQNRSRFGENKNYAEESDRVESKSSSQGGRWI